MPCPYCGSQHPREVSASAATGAAMTEVCPLAPASGDCLDGKYEIVREACKVATGVIYEANDKPRGRPVSVKTLLEATSGDAQLATRFRREARAAGALGDPHILHVLDAGRTPKGLLYLVSERIDGVPLSSLLAQSPRLAIPVAVEIMGQILAALSAAHKAGLVHRDINPECVFVAGGKGVPEVVKVTDFGVANAVAAPAGAIFGRTAGSAKLVGTPPYLSSEIVRGLNVAIDQRSDVYAAGALLYHMLCGSPPFAGNDLVQVLRAIVEGNYPRPRSLRPEIPAGLEAATVRALERDLRKRFATAAAMRAELSGEGARRTPRPAPSADAFASGLDTLVDAPVALTPPPPSMPAAHSLPVARAPAALAKTGIVEPVPLAIEELEPPPIRLDMTARQRAVARDRGAAARIAAAPVRKLRWWPLLVGALGAAVLAVVLIRFRRHAEPMVPAAPAAPVATTSVTADEIQRFRLRTSPEDANVTIDHVPLSARELPLDSGPPRPHEIRVAAPGHVTRSFTFTPSAGMELAIRLGHTLPVPLAGDPAPLPAELAASLPDEPRSGKDIDRAFADLDRYAACLAVAPAVAGASGGRLRELLEGEVFLPCRSLAQRQGSGLAAAAAAYAKAAQGTERPERLTRLHAAFRAEYLAERAVWQMHELARIGRDEGRHAAWHIRNVALAARAWVRARKSAAEAQQGKRLQSATEELVTYVRDGNGIGGIRGAEDFLRSTRAMLAVVRSNRPVADAVAFDACRKLLTDFDAMVLD